MLRVYIREFDDIPKDIEVVKDCDWEFSKLIGIPGTDAIKNILRYIDKAEWYSERQIKDRFGNVMAIDNISSGCKAAIVTSLNPDKAVDLIECGYNARDAILAYVKDGVIIMKDPLLSNKIVSLHDEEVEIRYGKYKFKTVGRFREYIQNEMPSNPHIDKNISIIQTDRG